MDYYDEIKENLLEIYDRAKDYSEDRNKVKTYFGTGRLLFETGKEYGKNIIKQYAERLVIDVGKKYNERNLRYMRKFYETFSNTKWNPVGTKLSWSHFRELLVLKDDGAIKYYMEICELKNLTRRELREKIRSKEFERLPLDTKNKIINTTALNAIDIISNPILIKDNREYDKFSEYALKELTLNNVDEF